MASDASLFERAAFVARQHPDADDMTFGEIVERLHEYEWSVEDVDVTEAPHE